MRRFNENAFVIPAKCTPLLAAFILLAAACTPLDVASEGQRVSFYVEQPDATGSATFVGNAQFLTAAHVVGVARQVDLTRGSTKWRANIVAADYDLDLALLEITSELRESPLRWADGVTSGAKVFAVGYPAPFGGATATVTAGIVSAVRSLNGVDYIQLDASVNPGNTGGPVISETGTLAGIIVARIRGAQNLNLAVSSSAARSFLPSPHTQGLDPRARELSDDYLNLSETMRSAALDPARALEMLGQLPQTGALSQPALNISTRLVALRLRALGLQTAGALGSARTHYQRAIELTFVDNATFISTWRAAASGRPQTLIAILDRALAEWVVGDDAARIH